MSKPNQKHDDKHKPGPGDKAVTPENKYKNPLDVPGAEDTDPGAKAAAAAKYDNEFMADLNARRADQALDPEAAKAADDAAGHDKLSARTRAEMDVGRKAMKQETLDTSADPTGQIRGNQYPPQNVDVRRDPTAVPGFSQPSEPYLKE